ncbi:MAG: hypothetical protein PHQ14_05980, partial [Chromatiales bacterium]|nr:hypothetical protein [Chromatiales bacterium]
MNTTEGKVTLHVEGRLVDAETVEGWASEAYALDGVARGAGTGIPELELDADDVLELELQDGSRLLVAAADAEQYLGPALGRGEGDEKGVIHIGPMLRPSGLRPPMGTAREGVGAWMLKALRIYRHGPAGMTALVAAGTYQDAQLQHHNGLYHCASNRFALTQAERLPASAEPTLLFIHGTASSTEGSFKGLWENEQYRKRLEPYGSRIYAFEHRSLTDSPITNALALVKTLP